MAAGLPGFILMLSGAAAKHFGVALNKQPKVDDFIGEGPWWACWRCELLGSNNKTGVSFFLLTNARTLYSLVFADSSRRIESLMADFVRILDYQFELAGRITAFEAGIRFRLVRGQPRSLIGSQNELVRCADSYVEHHGSSPSLEALSNDLNETPMLQLPEKFPDKAFKQHVVSDPPAHALSPSEVPTFPKPLQN